MSPFLLSWRSGLQGRGWSRTRRRRYAHVTAGALRVDQATLNEYMTKIDMSSLQVRRSVVVRQSARQFAKAALSGGDVDVHDSTANEFVSSVRSLATSLH